MEIASGDDLTRLNQDEWVVRGAIHLGGNDFFRQFNRIP